MSKLDGKQERLQELKTYRNFALASLLALIGFIFTKTDETNIYILFLTVLVIFVLQKKILKFIKEIEEL